MRLLLWLILITSLISCDYNCGGDPYLQNHKVMGWKPVYSGKDSALMITYQNSPEPTVKAGKIYAYGNLIMQNELGRGIHIIDNSDPANAHKIGFLKIGGNTDFSVKNGLVYANNYTDMVIISYGGQGAPQVVKRMPDAFSAGSEYYWNNPHQPGYYDCDFRMDSVVVAWVQDSVYANCYNP